MYSMNFRAASLWLEDWLMPTAHPSTQAMPSTPSPEGIQGNGGTVFFVPRNKKDRPSVPFPVERPGRI